MIISPHNSLSWNNIQLLKRKVNKESSHRCLKVDQFGKAGVWLLKFCSPDPFQGAEIGTEIDKSDRLNAGAKS
jgi:hypothetical protein